MREAEASLNEIHVEKAEFDGVAIDYVSGYDDGWLFKGSQSATFAFTAGIDEWYWHFDQWQSFIGAATTGASGPPEDDGPPVRELEDQLMGLKIKEADAVAELKEMRQKVMELETQNHVCTNQLKRQDDELKRVREEKEAAVVNEQKAATLLKEEQRKLEEAQSDMKEASVMQRPKYTEAMQTIADLKQNIAQLESKIAEKAAHAQLRGGSIVSDMDDDSAQSQRSGSYGDSNSIASEEMSAFIADATAKAHLLETPKAVPVAATAAAGGDQ
uniref:SH3 domain-containing protein n=1 Tax=Panagrellus redivivus TaxID=6233 RepID=A0A7E4VPM0_PANRE